MCSGLHHQLLRRAHTEQPTRYIAFGTTDSLLWEIFMHSDPGIQQRKRNGLHSLLIVKRMRSPVYRIYRNRGTSGSEPT